MLLKHPDITPKLGKYSFEGIDTKTFNSVTSGLQHYLEYRSTPGVLIIFPLPDSIFLANVKGIQNLETLWEKKQSHNDTVFVNALREIIAYCNAKNESLCIYLQANNSALRQVMKENGLPHNFVNTSPDNFIASKKGVLVTDNLLVEGYEFPVVFNLFDEQTRQKTPMVVDMLHRAVCSSNTILTSV